MGYIWLILAVLFGIIEAATVQMVCIWFAGGAICSLIAEFLGANTVWQIATFVVSSGILLILTRPLAKKLINVDKIRTNADSVIGKTAVVTKETDDLGLMGEAKVGGSLWTICSEDGTPIEKNEKVTVEKIEGVKLIVKR